ncbi:MAG: hypothetical protein ACI8YQ_000113 [Polaribacter sp.]|jgi:hypothetical protein
MLYQLPRHQRIWHFDKFKDCLSDAPESEEKPCFESSGVALKTVLNIKLLYTF